MYVSSYRRCVLLCAHSQALGTGTWSTSRRDFVYIPLKYLFEKKQFSVRCLAFATPEADLSYVGNGTLLFSLILTPSPSLVLFAFSSPLLFVPLPAHPVLDGDVHMASLYLMLLQQLSEKFYHFLPLCMFLVHVDWPSRPRPHLTHSDGRPQTSSHKAS